MRMHIRDHHERKTFILLQAITQWKIHVGIAATIVSITAEIADLLFPSSPSSYIAPTMPFIL
jgi:hypothetical protein